MGPVLTYPAVSADESYWSASENAGVAIASSNRIVVAGTTSKGLSALRYLENGKLDPTFGVDGFASN